VNTYEDFWGDLLESTEGWRDAVAYAAAAEWHRVTLENQ
jgi:hypothetical protein